MKFVNTYEKAPTVHFGAKGTNGGVSFFFCGGGPANVACPTGTSGTKVSGVVYVDTYNAAFGTGDELTGIPYSYTVQ